MPKRSITLVRHGHREDFAGNEWSPAWSEKAINPHDPDISERGIREAIALGKRLAIRPGVTILASPFLRTVHTASHVANALGSRVLIENGLHEMMHPDGFPHFPVLQSAQQLNNRFGNVNTEYSSVTVKSFPERTMGDVASRASDVLQTILAYHSGDLVLVTHADPLLGFLIAAGIDACRQPVHTCPVYQIDGCPGDWSLTINGDASHLDGTS